MESISIVIGKYEFGIDWSESLPSLGKVRFFIFDLNQDDIVYRKRIW